MPTFTTPAAPSAVPSPDAMPGAGVSVAGVSAQALRVHSTNPVFPGGGSSGVDDQDSNDSAYSAFTVIEGLMVAAHHTSAATLTIESDDGLTGLLALTFPASATQIQPYYIPLGHTGLGLSIPWRASVSASGLDVHVIYRRAVDYQAGLISSQQRLFTPGSGL